MPRAKVVIKTGQTVKAPKLTPPNPEWEHKVIIAMNLPKKKILAYIQKVKAIIQGLTGNLLFPTPSPTLPQLETDLKGLDIAQIKTKSKIVGSKSARNAAFKVIDADMDQLKLYLQGVINVIANTVSPEAAVAAAQSVNVSVKIVPNRDKVGFTAEQVTGTNSVALTGTKVASYNFHNWTVTSSDPTEIIRIQGSTKQKQTVPNLKKGNSYSFYHIPVTKDGELPPEGPIIITIV